MYNLIHLFVLIPVLGFVLSLFFGKTRESALSRTAYFTVGLNLALSVVYIAYWAAHSAPPLNFRDVALYHDAHYSFVLDFFFDYISATFLVVGNLITFLVVVYSRYYMHRESGYRRFFNTVLFFYLGYVITILAGNFETLFVGWEILGISSFLLIAFYRKRYLPVKNALKVFSIYRIGDVGLLLTMWMSHHLWHENVLFVKLSNYELVHQQVETHSISGILISLMLLIAASAKSAQLPFSAWLPRAMEGPTPSSAIFYGSLSVHIGTFLLLRTYAFWEHQLVMRILIAAIGIVTAVVTSMIARTQTTVKGQIAYSSASQIGIIFVEIAAGLDILALIHFAGNAFLRTYQLLTAPSAVTYLIREQSFAPQPQPGKPRSGWVMRVNRVFYLLSLKEWNLEALIFRIIFKPLKSVRLLLGFITLRNVTIILLFFYSTGLYLAVTGFKSPDFSYLRPGGAIVAAILAFLLVAKAYNERGSSRLAWLLVIFSHCFVHLAVVFNDHVSINETLLYLGGVVVSGTVGLVTLQWIHNRENRRIGLNEFNGLIYRYPGQALLFFLACLGMAGFPITTTFLGEDLILTHITEEQAILAALISFAFIVNGISVIRIYTRIFLGKITKSYQHPTGITL